MLVFFKTNSKEVTYSTDNQLIIICKPKLCPGVVSKIFEIS